MFLSVHWKRAKVNEISIVFCGYSRKMAWSGEQKRIENKKKNLDSRIKFSSWTPMNHAPTKDKVSSVITAASVSWSDPYVQISVSNSVFFFLSRL